MHKLRTLPIFHRRSFRAALLLLFPLALCFLTEFAQSQDLSSLMEFTLRRMGVVAFSYLFTAAIFWVGTLLTRRPWVGGLTTAVLYMTAATVDYYKTQSNGSHLLFRDLAMVRDLSGMGSFAKLYFSPILMLCCLGTALLILLLWCCDIRFSHHFGFRWLLSGTITWMTAFAVCVSNVFLPVCQVFGVDSTRTHNTFGEEERFSNNNLISNFVVSINQQVDSAVETPEDYSADTLDRLIRSSIETEWEQEGRPAAASEQESRLPNLIVVMSETFADFRALDEDPRLDQVYAPFDRIRAEENCWSGTNVVPTFGGGTVKTEFELLFGLPVKSLNDAFIPHELLGEGSNEIQSAFPSLYHDLGYSTSYIHPYSAAFYGREDTYDRYGFDRLLFLDDLTVPVNTYHNGYVDDDTVYRQAEAILEETEGPDFIHITSMQNHMPYDTAKDGTDEYSYYLEGIEKSCAELEEFLGRLEKLDEPTLVLFTGDHFPYFNSQDNIYQQTGMDSSTCSVLYEQACLIWSNQELNTAALPEQKISAFYLPHLLCKAAGLPDNAFTDAMLGAMMETPVYSIAEEMEQNDRLLDMLTYDRVLGEGYSNDEATVRRPDIKKESTPQKAERAEME